jgi:osomolarity two-component system sensor histidine kinase SLN1
MWSATFFILVWAFSTAFVAKPWELPDKIFYGGIAPVLTFPIFFAVIYDWPRDHDFLYQIYISVAVWGWSLYQLFFMFLCGFYGPAHANLSCGTKDFIGMHLISINTVAAF